MPFASGGAVPPQNPQPVYVPPQPTPRRSLRTRRSPPRRSSTRPFQEPGRFVVRNVRLAGQGPSITVSNGGVIEGTMEIQHNCPGCGGAINQVIVGLGNEPQAQQCVWNGGAHSRGFETVRFQLVIPNQPGTYEVRVRYAQAYSCQQGALGWWRVDRPQGPDARSNIGIVVVQGQQNPPPVVVLRAQQPPAQHANLIVDGGFEQLRLAPGTWQVVSQLPGWNLASGPGIELQNNVAGRAAEGAQLVELDSHASSAIYQDVQTVPGQTYELRLAYSARPGAPRIDNSVAVVLERADRVEPRGRGQPPHRHAVELPDRPLPGDEHHHAGRAAPRGSLERHRRLRGRRLRGRRGWSWPGSRPWPWPLALSQVPADGLKTSTGTPH
jgi:hypothetical protein